MESSGCWEKEKSELLALARERFDETSKMTRDVITAVDTASNDVHGRVSRFPKAEMKG
jgi:hypothetical protein